MLLKINVIIFFCGAVSYYVQIKADATFIILHLHLQKSKIVTKSTVLTIVFYIRVDFPQKAEIWDCDCRLQYSTLGNGIKNPL